MEGFIGQYVMCNEDKIKLFKEELGLIKNPKILIFVERAIVKIPDYFFVVAASSSGKYHPSYALGDGGLARHTKACVRIAVELFRMDMFKYSEDEKDLMIVALLLHDSRKHGDPQSLYVLANHPVLAANAIKNDEELAQLLPTEMIQIITDGILTHMGQWNRDYKTNQVIMPRPSNKFQNFIHWCDYIASRKCLEFNFDVDIRRE